MRAPPRESPSSTTLLACVVALRSAGSPTSWVAIAGVGSAGSAIGNAAIWCIKPNAARTRWQHCHSNPERPRSCYQHFAYTPLVTAAIPRFVRGDAIAGRAARPRELRLAVRAARACGERVERTTTTVGRADPQAAHVRRKAAPRTGDSRATRRRKNTRIHGRHLLVMRTLVG